MALAHKNSVKDMRTYSDQLRTKLSDAGRDPNSCKISFAIKPIIGETESIAKERWEEAQAHYGDNDVEVGLAQLSSTLGYDMSQDFACRTCHHLDSVARLHDGVSVCELGDGERAGRDRCDPHLVDPRAGDVVRRVADDHRA